MSKPTRDDDLTRRVEQFRALELPGQPMMMHIGTVLLVNDLHAALLEARAALKKAEGERAMPDRVIMVRESTYRDLREALTNMLHIMSSGVYRDSAGVKPSAHPDFDEAHAVLARAEREGLS